MVTTTIQVSGKLKQELNNFKMLDNESYEEVIWDLIEDRMELSEETKKDILEAEKDIKAGRVKSLEQIEKELGL